MPEEPTKWKEFERKTFEVQKSLSAENADVRHNDSIYGHDSKRSRQIDISIRSTVGTYSILVVVECKDYKTPVDVTNVEGFVTKVRDVRANKGVMVSAKGFTQAARNLADNHEIDLRQLIDTDSVEWGANVSVPCLLQRTYMASFSPELHDFNELPLQSQKLLALELRTEDSDRLQTLTDILHRKWDSHEIPHSLGTHRVVIGEKVVTEFCGVKQYGRIYAHVAVEHAFYSGKVPIHFQGFLNAKTGGLITRRILTGVISPIAVEKGDIPGWNQIDDPSKVTPSPAFTIGYFDVYFPPDGQAKDADTAWPDFPL